MTRPRAFATALLALGLAACGMTEAADRPPARAAAATAGATVPASLAAGDLDFVLHAAQGGLSEVTLGRLAQERAGAAEVRQFGQRMVEDHTRANEELARLVQPRGVVPERELPEAHRAVERTLATLSGQAFDEEYLGQQVGGHRAMLALFEHAARHARDPALKEFAARQVPIVQQHLEQAQALHQRVTRGGRSS